MKSHEVSGMAPSLIIPLLETDFYNSIIYEVKSREVSGMASSLVIPLLNFYVGGSGFS